MLNLLLLITYFPFQELLLNNSLIYLYSNMCCVSCSVKTSISFPPPKRVFTSKRLAAFLARRGFSGFLLGTESPLNWEKKKKEKKNRSNLIS